MLYFRRLSCNRLTRYIKFVGRKFSPARRSENLQHRKLVADGKPVLPTFLCDHPLAYGTVIAEPVRDDLAMRAGYRKGRCTFGGRIFDPRRPLPAAYAKPHRGEQRAVWSCQAQGKPFGIIVEESEAAFRWLCLSTCLAKRKKGTNGPVRRGPAQIVAQQAEGRFRFCLVFGKAGDHFIDISRRMPLMKDHRSVRGM